MTLILERYEIRSRLQVVVAEREIEVPTIEIAGFQRNKFRFVVQRRRRQRGNNRLFWSNAIACRVEQAEPESGPAPFQWPMNVEGSCAAIVNADR